jgi:hypothetical protein
LGEWKSKGVEQSQNLSQKSRNGDPESRAEELGNGEDKTVWKR